MEIISLLIYGAACAFQTSMCDQRAEGLCALYDDDDDGWEITVKISQWLPFKFVEM